MAYRARCPGNATVQEREFLFLRLEFIGCMCGLQEPEDEEEAEELDALLEEELEGEEEECANPAAAGAQKVRRLSCKAAGKEGLVGAEMRGWRVLG